VIDDTQLVEPRYKKRRIPDRTRRAVALRHGATPGCGAHPVKCVYCNRPGSLHWPCHYSGEPQAWVHFSEIELDHFVPEWLGGSSEPENIVLACRRCNRSKGSKSYEQWGGPT